MDKNNSAEDDLYKAFSESADPPQMEHSWFYSRDYPDGWITNERQYRYFLCIKVLKDYKKINSKIKLRLFNRNEIQFSGKIIEINNEDGCSGTLKLDQDGEIVIIPIIDVDSTTIMPYNVKNQPIIQVQRTNLPTGLRFDILNRDNYTCQYCGRMPPEVELEIDHINLVSKGGNNEHNNLLTSCKECNRGKSSKLIGKKE